MPLCVYPGKPADVSAAHLHLHGDETGHHGAAAGAAAPGEGQQLPQPVHQEAQERQVCSPENAAHSCTSGCSSVGRHRAVHGFYLTVK